MSNRRFDLSSSESKRMENIEKQLNYVLYLLIFLAALGVGIMYLMQQLVLLLSY